MQRDLLHHELAPPRKTLRIPSPRTTVQEWTSRQTLPLLHNSTPDRKPTQIQNDLHNVHTPYSHHVHHRHHHHHPGQLRPVRHYAHPRPAHHQARHQPAL